MDHALRRGDRRPPHMLVIEDAPDLRALYVDAFHEEGYTVTALRPVLRHATMMLVKEARVARTEAIVHTLRAEGDPPS